MGEVKVWVQFPAPLACSGTSIILKLQKLLFFFPNRVYCLHLNLLMDSFCSKTGMKNGFGNADSDSKILLGKKKNEDFKKIEE